MRFALLIEFVSAIAGAMILVNTIVLVKGGLRLIDRDYELIMAAFGVGATIAAFVSGAVDKTKSRRISLIMGALILGVAISFANHLNFPMLFLVWIVAGLGQSLAEIPSETLIGETVPIEEHGNVYTIVEGLTNGQKVVHNGVFIASAKGLYVSYAISLNIL